jgi:hypothetical protein
VKQSKRHHYLAQSFQQRFTDAAGKLYIFDKRRRHAGVRYGIPKNEFVQTDLYTIIEKDGSRDTSLENWYSKLESDIAPIIDKIAKEARAQRLPLLSFFERSTWDMFFYHQQKRGPDIFRKLGLVQRLSQLLPNLIAEFERDFRPLTPNEREEFKSPATFERLTQYASVRARGQGSSMVMSALAARGIAVALITNPNKSFVIGDYPLARMGPDGTLSHPETELWLPIAADVAVSPWGNTASEKLILIGTEHVRTINKVIFDHSNVIAGRSEALIRSLADLL